MDRPLIPVNRPGTPKNASKYFAECASSGWFSCEGPYVKQFEEEFAKYIGTKYAVTTNAGTTALHLALLALGVSKGDEVILPASTIASCFFAIWYIGATAVPVDVDDKTYTLDPSLIEKKITKKTKAIMPVHLFGHPCDMDAIMEIAKKHHLFVVEDAAEAHGAEYKGRKVGTFGEMSCYSFYGNKIVTSGEGGMVVTNDKNLYETALSLRNLHHTKETRFIHQGVGYKYVISNMQAALGVASLEEVDESIRFKRKMAELYTKELSNVKGLVLPLESNWAKNVYWMYAIRVQEEQFGISRNDLMERLLNKYNIQTRSFFYAPNTAFRKLDLYQDESFPIAELIAQEGVYLPSGLGNSFEEFQYVCSAIKEIASSIQK